MRIVRSVTWDDYFIVVAWCIALGLTLSISLAAGNGLGRHDKDIPGQDWVTLRNCEYVFSVLYVGIINIANQILHWI